MESSTIRSISSPTIGGGGGAGAFPVNSTNNLVDTAPVLNIGNGVNTGKNGPKYSFHKSISFNRSNRNQNSLSFGGGCIIKAIIEGKGSDRGQIGMATMDVRSSELILCQFVDTSSYSLLKIRLALYDPVEIILPEEKEKNAIINDVIRNTCPKATITPILRRYFNDALGIELIKKHSVEECSQIDASINMKYYCMSAAAALIKYVEYIQNIAFTPNSLKITYISIENSCMIDVNSWKSLDLIHLDMKPVKGKPNSMFEILNCCVTSSGMNMLKSYLLQPSAELAVINQRLDIVEELVRNQSMCDRLRNILSNLGDLRQLISLCTYFCVGTGVEREESKRAIRFKITQVNALKNLLESVKKLSLIVCASRSQFFVQCKEKLEDSRLDEISNLITGKITAEGFNKKRKGSALSTKDIVLFTVAEKQHIQLDLARRTYHELVEHITDLGNKQQKEIPGAVLNYNQSRGYHFSLHANDPYIVTLPPYCIQNVFNKSSITFTTRELVKFNDRLLETENEILQKSNLIMDQLLASIRQFLPVLYHCAEIISQLDYYCALACYSSRISTIRPKFEGKLAIQNGRHPILDYRKEIVPNNTFASHDAARFIVIAGPNMAGKTTYMRQVCLLQILAQMGCMVPADSASFRLMTRIFSRVGHNDDLTRNLSGFSVEMSEMAVILQNCDQNSLVIIDELARSTSTEEGIAICYAICESLLSSKAIVFIATHFLDMAQLASNYPGIVLNYHFDPMAIIDANGIERPAPRHKLVEGAYRGPLYGLDLAELTTFPEKIIANAREMAARIRKAKERPAEEEEDKLGENDHSLQMNTSIRTIEEEDTSENDLTMRMNTSNPNIEAFNTPIHDNNDERWKNLNSTI